METQLLEQFERFQSKTGDAVSAAILTLAVSLASDKGKRTGLTTREAAEFLGIGVTTVKELCRDGRLKPTRIGRCVRFNADELETFQRRKPIVEEVGPLSDLRHFQRKR